MGARWNRRIRQTDANQADVIAGLEKAGVKVYVIGEPCDLLCRFWCGKHNRVCWEPLEVKPLVGKKAPKPRKRTDQPDQNQFLADTGVKVVTSATEALLALSVH
jgi:hypothetical protein